MKFIVSLALCMNLWAPTLVIAQTIASQPLVKTPLSYSLREYGVVLATALLGGAASWYMKVRKGELMAWNLSSLIGELCVSAFAGLIAFWLCEYFNLNPLLTSAVVGMSGHAGAKGLIWLEGAGQRIMEKKLGLAADIGEPAKPSETLQ